MRLTSIKDCKNCEESIVIGSINTPTVKCNSSDYANLKLFRENGRYCAGSCKGYKECNKTRTGLIEQDKALNFMLAGKSEFILHSTKTNEDFRFLLTKEKSEKDESKFIYFVNIICTTEKIYAGILIQDDTTKEFEFKQGKNGSATDKNIDIRSLIFVLNKLNNNDTVQNLEVYNIGKCGCCGNKLVTADGFETGLCKICSKTLKSRE